jgi:hypothetical protein
MTFHTSRADIISFAFSQSLVHIVCLIVQTNISVPFKISTIILYLKKSLDLQFLVLHLQFKRLPEALNGTGICDGVMNYTRMSNL